MYEACQLCAHRCGVDRTAGERGVCGVTDALMLARAALHFWEEPPISGTRGSGTVFFSGCSLGCLYCQNEEISHARAGKTVSPDRLFEIFFELKAKGAHNVNLVTPTHYVPTIRETLLRAKAAGLDLPIVYNTGSYDTVETLSLMDGLTDIYLPDFKYIRSAPAAAYSHAPDYPEAAKAAIAEMVRQQPSPVIGEDGLMRCGVIVRVLLLPGHVADAKLAVRYLHETYGDRIYISLMNQYTPCRADLPSPLHRRVTRAEYRDLVDYADKIGVRLGFTQEEGTAEESFIPPFDGDGV